MPRNKAKQAESRWRCWLRQQFGISTDDYIDQLAYQGGVCAVCGGSCLSGRHLAVDHCHQTGQLRGLLCFKCNVGIGALGDDPALLRRAIIYLENGASPANGEERVSMTLFEMEFAHADSD